MSETLALIGRRYFAVAPDDRARLIEMLALFLLAPIIAWALVRYGHVKLHFIYPPAFLLCVLALTLDPTFRWRSLGADAGRAEFLRILKLFVLFGGALIAITLIWVPEKWLYLPLNHAPMWAVIMIGYPLMSVTTQEIMYRKFFFHRYEHLFGGNDRLLIGFNAVAFGLAHAIMQNFFAVWVSAIGGLLFAHTYHKSRSFKAVCLEHALYGCLIFTIGLGWYFFSGAYFMEKGLR